MSKRFRGKYRWSAGGLDSDTRDPGELFIQDIADCCQSQCISRRDLEALGYKARHKLDDAELKSIKREDKPQWVSLGSCRHRKFLRSPNKLVQRMRKLCSTFQKSHGW